MSTVRCFYCDRLMWPPNMRPAGASRKRFAEQIHTRDHIIPRATGGVGLEWNIVSACMRCNVVRDVVPAEVFLEFAFDCLRSSPEMTIKEAKEAFEAWRSREAIHERLTQRVLATASRVS